jgi:hypothetical protein
VGRPKLKDELKRGHVSISVKKTVDALAAATPNKSHFYETSVESCQALALIIGRLRAKKLTLQAAMEEVEDIADIWTAEFDEIVPFDLPSKEAPRKRSQR